MASNKTNDNWADKILKEVEAKESNESEYYGGKDYRFETNSESALHYANNVVNTIAWHF